MIGKTISHYKILEKLGEGGMGVVYKAEDTKLGRLVALKFLPEQLQANEAEKARFLQEARAASTLNHPNVCTIHDIMESDGRLFIVMEYVEGKTLRQLTPITTLSECLDYAIQIGEGLKEAHSHDIIHRDVKSENIMVNAKKQIKIMDFGLAKVKGSLKLTKSSSTAGTLAYMAPEQIQETTVDARADIFSFGVVLYEMLTGHLPFHGEHEAAMVYSIVNEEPVPIQNYLPDSSSELQHILNRALEKDPQDRYQNIQDMIIDLRRVKKETGRISRPAPGPVPQIAAELPKKIQPAPSRVPLLKIAAYFLFALLVIVAGFFMLRDRSIQVNPNMKARYVSIPYLDAKRVTASKDGNWLIFAAKINSLNWNVFIMNLVKGEPRCIAKDSCINIINISISPDASEIVYSRIPLSGKGIEVVKMTLLGGSSKVIYENQETQVWPDWLPDGKRLALSMIRPIPQSTKEVHELWTLALDGSDLRFVLADTAESGYSEMAFSYSSDCRLLAWIKSFPEGHSEIMVRDLASGKDRQLTFDKKIASNPIWAPGGSIIFSSNRGGNQNLWAIPAAGGAPVQVTRGSGLDIPVTFSWDEKRLFYHEATPIGQIKIVNLVDGMVQPITPEDEYRLAVQIAPGGKMIAFSIHDFSALGNKSDIYLYDRESKVVSEFLDNGGANWAIGWSPDEQWLVYSTYDVTQVAGIGKIYAIPMNKAGQSRYLGKGAWQMNWLNSKEFLIDDATATYKGSLDNTDLIKISEDSTWVIPVVNNQYMLIMDHHKRKGEWRPLIVPMASYLRSGRAEARSIPVNDVYRFSNGNTRMYYLDPKTNIFHCVTLPEGKDEELRTIPGLGVRDYAITEDGKELVYSDRHTRSRLVILEEPFK